MTPKMCRYQCGVMLDAWDEEARKYREAGSGGLHTKERCEEMKAKSRVKQGENNHNHDNHGNELVQPLRPTENRYVKPPYVDHTQVAKEDWKHKTITDPTPEGFDLKINNFGETHKIRASQFQIAGALYTISIWYEEIPLKQ